MKSLRVGGGNTEPEVRVEVGFAEPVCQVGSASTALQPFSLEHAPRAKGLLLPADSVGGHEGGRHLLIPLAVTASPPPAQPCRGVQPLAPRLLTDQSVNNWIEAKLLVPLS